MNLNVTQKTTVDVTREDIIYMLREKFCVRDYSIKDGVLYEYQRVSWDDYEYVVAEGINTERYNTIVKRLLLLDSLSYELKG